VRKKHSHIKSFAVGIFGCINLFSIPSVAQNKEITNESIFNSMFAAIQNVKTLRYNLTAFERVDNTYNHAHSLVKLNVSPYKAYYKDLNKGIEVLWVDGQEDGDAIVNPNGFPYVNLHLSPLGKLMRKGQHQTMLRLGYAYLGDVLSHSLAKFPDVYKNYMHRLGDTVWDNSSCYKMDINFTLYTNTPYIVTKKGETVSSIATKKYLNDYEVLTLNNISWFEDELNIGQRILLPAAYAKHVVLFIDKKTCLPTVIRIYDDKGLFETYEFTNLQINSTILDSEFSENYPGYHF
jgi:hypothetical protein